MGCWTVDHRTGKTVRSNPAGASLSPDDGVVFADTEDVYEQLLRFFDKVGAAYVDSYERLTSLVDEYQDRLASGYGFVTRATYAQIGFVGAVVRAGADLSREMAKACAAALRDAPLRTRD